MSVIDLQELAAAPAARAQAARRPLCPARAARAPQSMATGSTKRRPLPTPATASAGCSNIRRKTAHSLPAMAGQGRSERGPAVFRRHRQGQRQGRRTPDADAHRPGLSASSRSATSIGGRSSRASRRRPKRSSCSCNTPSTSSAIAATNGNATTRNEPSKRAAERFGFKFEGIFRQHMVVKGENRDTAWYSIIDREWPALKAAYQAWLSPDNFDANGKQIKRLEEFRAP